MKLAIKLWLITAITTGLTLGTIVGSKEGWAIIFVLFFCSIGSAIASIPLLIMYAVYLPVLAKKLLNTSIKMYKLWLMEGVIAAVYALAGAIIVILIKTQFSYWEAFLMVWGALLCCSFVAKILCYQALVNYFNYKNYTYPTFKEVIVHTFFKNKKPIIMQTDSITEGAPQPITKNASSNSILLKAAITGVLILVMLIPSLFLISLVNERQQRQSEVVNEVTQKWAGKQVFTAPFITVPYINQITDNLGKTISRTEYLYLLPDNLQVEDSIVPEIRPRSIYKVLLYKSNIHAAGNFKNALPRDVPESAIQWNEARICIGLSDYKGIEGKVVVNFDGNVYELMPGLSQNVKGIVGLSANISLNGNSLAQVKNFSAQIQLKGSEQMHFVPFSGNSKFKISSSWPNPSFDGNTLPGDRQVSEKGFASSWSFNKANIPFGTTVNILSDDMYSLAFGVSLLQPADHYAKTMRSVKYAILFIGLTFALCFIIELMQQKPLHPVQYVLVGMALSVFYTLLLSISEFILFDYAYLVAAIATILLISMYAKSHFHSWKTGVVFGAILSGLYGFIFVLIRLEDTALLVGSIGLFCVLALVMFFSRRINWYQ